jgi:hypothetical protein
MHHNNATTKQLPQHHPTSPSGEDNKNQQSNMLPQSNFKTAIGGMM